VNQIAELSWCCVSCGHTRLENPGRATRCACGNGRYRMTRQCPCGRIFSLSRKSQWACSISCSNKHRLNTKKGRTYPHLRRAPVIACATCGVLFRATRTCRSRPAKYCTHDCYMKSRAETEPERKVRCSLESLGIEHEVQVRIERWTVDFLCGNVVLEVDGDYWHDKPEVAEKDARKDAWLAANGYDLIRVRESELGDDPCDVIRKRWTAYAELAGLQAGAGALE